MGHNTLYVNRTTGMDVLVSATPQKEKSITNNFLLVESLVNITRNYNFF